MMQEAKIEWASKSYKYPEKLYIKLSSGRSIMRKISERKSGTLKGMHFSVNCNIFSFKFDENDNRAEEITWVGNYKKGTGVFENETYEEIQVPEVAPKVEEIEVIEIEDGEEVRHEQFNKILACVEADIPVYLHGPAGSGKNHTLQQLADVLDLEFYFTNSVQQEYKITGFIDAGGNFHETEFYKAFTNGGLFFLDELDASIPEVLVLLNAAIANRYFEFPNGKVYAHEDFRVVAAGNTTGDGADEQYTGRLQIDQSTLDRFVYIEFDYSEKVELAIAKGNKELVEFVRGLRRQAVEKGVRATFSYRCLAVITKLEGKMKLEEILTIAVFKGMDRDTMNTFRPDSTRYGRALEALAR